MNWDLCESGPADAKHTVLLLPGGLCTATFYAELMAEPSLAHVRLIAATLPGHGGTPAPTDFGIEHAAALVAKLAADRGCDVVMGFSNGATVALEMVVSGGFGGPVVLTGPSFSTADEPAFLGVFDRVSRVTAGLPYRLMPLMMRALIASARVPAARKAQMRAEFSKNKPRATRQVMERYMDYLRSGDAVGRLCDSGVPAWVVHAEKGDGGLTAEERRRFSACPTVQLVTVPGKSWLLPNEEPAQLANVVVEALREA